jgi:hypothetical protein
MLKYMQMMRKLMCALSREQELLSVCGNNAAK